MRNYCDDENKQYWISTNPKHKRKERFLNFFFVHLSLLKNCWCNHEKNMAFGNFFRPCLPAAFRRLLNWLEAVQNTVANWRQRDERGTSNERYLRTQLFQSIFCRFFLHFSFSCVFRSCYKQRFFCFCFVFIFPPKRKMRSWQEDRSFHWILSLTNLFSHPHFILCPHESYEREFMTSFTFSYQQMRQDKNKNSNKIDFGHFLEFWDLYERTTTTNNA